MQLTNDNVTARGPNLLHRVQSNHGAIRDDLTTRLSLRFSPQCSTAGRHQHKPILGTIRQSLLGGLGTTALTGTSGTADQTSIAVQTGLIQIENRYIYAREYSYVFLC